MSFFEDKKFESMDWLSKVTEPFIYSVNDLISQIPEEVPLSLEDIAELIEQHSSLHITTKNVIHFLIKKYNLAEIHRSICDHDLAVVDSCFELNIIGTPVIDYKNNILRDGEIKLVKTKSILGDKELSKLLGEKTQKDVWCLYENDNETKQRLNKVLLLLGRCEKAIKSNSFSNKKEALYFRMKEFFQNNEWNIKNVDLSNKIGTWIASYVEDNNLKGLANLYKLKAMSFKGNPIYSMEEIL